MKGLMHWFKSSNKMKRWILLILVGIILTCYGFAKILVRNEISFVEVEKVVAIFVVGFVSIILGLIFLNKRTLEILIESTDSRMADKKNVNINSLIFNKKIYDRGPNIVVIGGGTGLNTVLQGLKKYTSNLTAIVAVSDYGEKTEEYRRELNLLPVDDIKQSVIALSENEEQVEKLFNYKFNNGRLAGINFSDMFFSAMQAVNGNFENSIIKSNEVINIIGRVLPVTLDEMKIVAELENGYMVEEKSKIPEIVSDKITKINRIILKPSNCKAAPGVIEAIKEADCIVIGPGSLYTNVIPNLLVSGVSRAVKESPAMKVYISNIMTEQGQTDNYSVADHLNAIIEHCGTGIIDYCIYDTGEIIPEFIKKYNYGGQDLVEQNIDKIKGVTFLQRNLSMVKNDYIRHDPRLVAKSIIELICDDLKYQDKQNDPQYMMLNTKLKEDKKFEKKKKEACKNSKKKKSANIKKSKSKFTTKYSNRIESIKEADKKARAKMEKNKSTMENIQSEEKKSSVKPKSARGKKKMSQEIRDEMIAKLEESNFRDK